MSQRIQGQSSRSKRDMIGRVHEDRGNRNMKKRNVLWSVLVLVIGVVLVLAFFYWDRHGQISHLILSLGSWGIILSIALMTLFCIIPVPSEFLIILNMKVFHVWWGILYSWLGSMLGCIAVFLMARYFVRNLFTSFISEEQMSQVESWVARRGVTGLILARIIPLPFIVVNYTAGIVRSVTLWNFTWTSAVGGIPYYTGAALIFLGVSKKYVAWLAVGGAAVIAVWIIGMLYNKNSNIFSRWTH